jgi:hypothetical protein
MKMNIFFLEKKWQKKKKLKMFQNILYKIYYFFILVKIRIFN